MVRNFILKSSFLKTNFLRITLKNGERNVDLLLPSVISYCSPSVDCIARKSIPFESVLINLNGNQLHPEFLALNPFHHVPVLVEQEVKIVESLAILDYLEAQYPSSSLLPQSPEEIARIRIVQTVAVNEIMPKLPALAVASDRSQFDEEITEYIARFLDFSAN